MSTITVRKLQTAEPSLPLGERLISAGLITQDQLDQAVANYDLILVAWGDRMDEIAGSGCGDPPTLRDVR